MMDLTVFPNEETFQRIYDECLDDMPMASEAVQNSYKGMGKIFEQYLGHFQEDIFRYAYQCGYKAAMKKQGFCNK